MATHKTRLNDTQRAGMQRAQHPSQHLHIRWLYADRRQRQRRRVHRAYHMPRPVCLSSVSVMEGGGSGFSQHGAVMPSRRWLSSAPLYSDVALQQPWQLSCQCSSSIWRLLCCPLNVLKGGPRCHRRSTVRCPRQVHSGQPRTQRARVQVGSTSLCSRAKSR